MQRKSMGPVAINPKSTFSQRGKPTGKSSWKSALLLGMLGFSVLAGTLMMSSRKPSLEAHRALLVRSVLEIKDDHSAGEEKVVAKHIAGPEQVQASRKALSVDHPSPAPQHIDDHIHDHESSPSVLENVDTFNEDDERQRALASVSSTLTESRQVEGFHQAKLDEVRAQRDQREKKYREALSEYRKLASKSQGDGTPNSNFKGILTKCYIKGHDVHWINENGWILSHVNLQRELSGNAHMVRNYINASDSVVIGAIWEKGYEIYDTNGNVLKNGNEN